MSKTSKRTERKTINLALQGGGTHGAFTWGVLDRLLEEETLDFEAITATSAGAINGTILCYGMAKGGRKMARALLEKFWWKISHMANVTALLRPTVLDKMLGHSTLDFSPTFVAFDYLTRIFSPYQLNVFDINPLRDVIKEVIQFDTVQTQNDIKLFVNATNVKSGRIKIFHHYELTLEMLLASACLPFFFKTVEINGEYYWDGGYSGNPAIFPLFYESATPDVLLVQINPLYVDEIPTNAPDILDRVNEISFNSTLMREMRTIALVTKLIEEGTLSHKQYKNMFIHLIEADEILSSLGRSSKVNVDWEFLTYLKETGRQTASDWLNEHYDTLGVRSSIDIHKMFLE